MKKKLCNFARCPTIDLSRFSTRSNNKKVEENLKPIDAVSSHYLANNR